MHLPCVRKYFRAQTEPRCPQCNDLWSWEIPGTKEPLYKKLKVIIPENGL